MQHSTRPNPQRWFAFAALCLISFGFLFPILWLLSTSLKPLDKVATDPPQYIPRQIQFHTTSTDEELKAKASGAPLSNNPQSKENFEKLWDERLYAQLFIDLPSITWSNLTKGTALPIPENYWRVITHEKMDFPRYTRNTLVISALSVIGMVISCSLVAYGFAKINFKGRGFLFALMIATMMIPFPVLMVSLFTIFRWIGDYTPFEMLGTLKPLWLPAWFGSAFNIFLLRQFYLTVPNDLSEAARIDGCSEFGIWWRIILPLSRSALLVVALFTFMASWNNFFGALIYVQHREQYTLSLGLQVFQSAHGGTEWNLLMAASFLIMAPVLVLFFLMQRTFIEGIATTGMKG